MARKTSSFAFCDGPGCKVSIETAEGVAPEGWYKVFGSAEGKYENRLSWEFHSLLCVEKFCKGRRAAKGEKITRSSHGSTTNEILECFQMSDEPLTVREISDLTGKEITWVHKQINSLFTAGTIFKVTEGRGKVPSTYRINS